KDLGPILNEKQFKHIQSLLEVARAEGEIITGGHAVQVPGNEAGFYIEPTIIDGLNRKSRLAQEEVFGPVLTVFTFEDEREAIELANDTDYGLVTGIWTQDIDK